MTTHGGKGKKILIEDPYCKFPPLYPGCMEGKAGGGMALKNKIVPACPALLPMLSTMIHRCYPNAICRGNLQSGSPSIHPSKKCVLPSGSRYVSTGHTFPYEVRWRGGIMNLGSDSRKLVYVAPRRRGINFHHWWRNHS
jgi:hypothetical protein